MYNLSCVERSFSFFSLCASIQMTPQWNKCTFIFGTGTSKCVRYMLVNKILIRKIFAVWDILFHKYMSERIQVTVYLWKFFTVNEIRVELRTFRISHSQFRWLWDSSDHRMEAINMYMLCWGRFRENRCSACKNISQGICYEVNVSCV